jgi:dihydrofolate reductase
MTLDGVVDSPGGQEEGHPSGGWVLRTPFDPESFSLKGEELAETTALMFGRRSYEAFAPIWRDSEDHAAYRDLPKYVVSTTLQHDDLIDGWGTIEILRSVDDVASLKNSDGGAVFIHGSAELARNLADADLVDRYNLLVYPVLLGSGKRVFDTVDRQSQTLALRESAAYANGVVKVVYDVAR